MILVYTHQITPRLSYVFNILFKHFLSYDIRLTVHLDEFISFDGMKISYTKKPLGNELFFSSHSILFEKGILDQSIHVKSWNGKKIFFEQTESSALPFDVFAASFYLLSRYEECLPHIKDRFHRFPAKESLAYKNDFLKVPIIEYWLKDLVEIIDRNEKAYKPPTHLVWNIGVENPQDFLPVSDFVDQEMRDLRDSYREMGNTQELTLVYTSNN